MTTLVGTEPNQIPTNADLGDLAYQNAASIAGAVGVGGNLSVTGDASVAGSFSYSGTLTGGTGAITIGVNQIIKDVAGNVGIGVTPTQKLHVSGNILATGTFLGPDGTVSVPAFSFSSDPNTGMYRSGADVLDFAAAGTQYLRIDGVQGALTITAPLRLPNGTASSPALVNSGSLTTGVYFPTSTSIGLSTVNTVRLTVSTTAFTATLPWQGQNGTAAAPAFSASADTNTGVYFPAAGQVALSTGGTVRLTTSTTAITSTLPWRGPNGSSSEPALSATFATNTGVYFPAAETLGISTAGTERLRISAEGDIINNGVFYYNGRTITASITLSATNNAASIGPIIISNPSVVTVPDGGNWLIL